MTTPPTGLLTLLDALAECHLSIARIATSDVAAGRELVALRRELSRRTGAIGEALNTYLVSLNPAVQQEGRRRLADMRAAAALHQAEWPAVRLLESSAAYRLSAERVRESHRAFDQWLRAHLTARAATQPPGRI